MTAPDHAAALALLEEVTEDAWPMGVSDLCNSRMSDAIPAFAALFCEAEKAKIRIGARLGGMTAVQREVEINQAWHMLDRAVAAVAAKLGEGK